MVFIFFFLLKNFLTRKLDYKMNFSYGIPTNITKYDISNDPNNHDFDVTHI